MGIVGAGPGFLRLAAGKDMVMNIRRIRSGFTIIELLVVISIIALLISILLPAVGKARDNAKVAVSRSNLRELGNAMHQYVRLAGPTVHPVT